MHSSPFESKSLMMYSSPVTYFFSKAVATCLVVLTSSCTGHI